MERLNHKLHTSITPVLLFGAVLIFIMAMCFKSVAQTPPVAAKRDTAAVKDTMINKVSYKLYVGAKGGRYIWVTSRNGNVYKRYFAKKS